MALKLTEKDVAKQVQSFLEFRGWRKLRNNVGVRQDSGPSGEPRFIPFGERGMPDLLFLRYFHQPKGGALVLWVETKRPGARMDCRCRVGDKKLCRHCQQQRWRDTERLRGALVAVADDIYEFDAWYATTFGWLHQGPHADGQLRLIP